MKYIIISNCCSGYALHNIISDTEYNNPFVGNLILDDNQFLKLCSNIKNYMLSNVKLTDQIRSNEYTKQTKHERYNNIAVSKNYPVISLNDIDVHCVHNNNNDALEKFKKRQKRFNDIVKNEEYIIINILSYTTMFIDHDNCVEFINKFLKNNDKTNNIFYLFLGPKLDGITEKHYIIDNHMNKNIIRRKDDNVNVQINFDREVTIFKNYIINNII